MTALIPINYAARAKAIRARLWGVSPRVNWITHPPVQAQPQARPVPQVPELQHDAHVTAWRHRNDVITAEMMVATNHGLTPADLRGPCRKGPVSRARQELCYRAVEDLSMSLNLIGQRLAGRDHSTILHNYRSHARRHDLPMRNVGRAE